MSSESEPLVEPPVSAAAADACCSDKGPWYQRPLFLCGVCCGTAAFVAGIVVVLMLFNVGVFGGDGGDSGSGASGDMNASAFGGCSRSSDVVECEWGPKAFLEFEKVSQFVFNNSNTSGVDLELLLPQRVTLRYDEALMANEIGRDAALDGYLAFALYMPGAPTVGDDDAAMATTTAPTYASYLVVMHWNGTLRSVLPTTSLDSGYASTHMDAIKLSSPDTILTQSNEWLEEVGFPYEWEWRKETRGARGEHLTRLSKKSRFSSHDVQWGADNASYWQPTGSTNHTLFAKFHSNGTQIAQYLVPDCGDMNHVQLVENETRAVVSCRLTDSIVNYNVLEERVEWVAGGSEGTFTIVADGVASPPGASYWSGQHNVEYVGDDTYLMFDNAFAMKTASRILEVVINESTQVATIGFEYSPVDSYPTGYSETFGDNDVLPSTNHLTVWWPGLLDPDLGVMYDTQILEVTKAAEVAYELDVYGAADCDSDTDIDCVRSVNAGWKIYSVERFYDSPRVYNATFYDGALEFLCHSSFKLSRSSTGSYALYYERERVAAGEVVFRAYWAASTVTERTNWGTSTDDVAYRDMTLVVTDAWGRWTSLDVKYTPPRR